MSGDLWTFGHNTAGFLPDATDPAEPMSWEEAWNDLLDELNAAEESDKAVDPAVYGALEDAWMIITRAPADQPLTVTVRTPGQVPEEWWIARVVASEASSDPAEPRTAPPPGAVGVTLRSPNQPQPVEIGLLAGQDGYEPVWEPLPQRIPGTHLPAPE
jgi:hypothetical protein